MTAPVKDRTRRFAAGKYEPGKDGANFLKQPNPDNSTKKSTELFRKLKETGVC
jgi:hypothetical protein